MSAWPEQLGEAIHQGNGVYKLPDGTSFTSQAVTLTSGEEISMPKPASSTGSADALMTFLAATAAPATAAPTSQVKTGTTNSQLMIMAVVAAGFYFLFIQGRGRA